MKDSLLKFRLIYLPYLLIALCLIGGYTFLHWFLVIYLRLFEPKEILVEFVFPGVLAFLASYIWLRPCVKTLCFKKREDDWHFNYWFFPVLLLAIPAVMGQMYLTESTGKLLHMNKIGDIYDQPLEKYYQVDQLYIDKRLVGFTTNFETTDKGRKLVMEIYAAIPVYDSAEDPNNGVVPYAWYGKKYTHTVSHSLSASDKELEYRTFAQSTDVEFNSSLMTDYTYLEREGNTSSCELFREAAKNSSVYRDLQTPEVVLIPHKGDFESRTGSSEMWFWIVILFSLVVYAVMLVFPTIDMTRVKVLSKDKTNPIVRSLRTFIVPLIPEKGMYGSYMLIALNVLLFVIMAISSKAFLDFKVPTLVNWGGASHVLIFESGEYWRLFTAMFIHGGFLHLIMNMFALLMASAFVEPLLGTKRFLPIYFLSGLCASLVSAYINTDVSVCVGASGAIMGVFGLLGAFLLTRVFAKESFVSIGLFLLIFVGYNLLMGLLTNADNAAHIGGLIAGFIIGLILRFTIKWESVSDDCDKNVPQD